MIALAELAALLAGYTALATALPVVVTHGLSRLVSLSGIRRTQRDTQERKMHEILRADRLLGNLKSGADDRTRTGDLLFTKQLLYH